MIITKQAQITIVLPLPPKALHPNASRPASRGAAIARSKATAKARGDAKLGTLAALNGQRPPAWRKVTVHATFYLGPRGRHADPANLNGWLKATGDGIQDALGINDQNFTWLSPAQSYGAECRETKVVITVRNDE